MASIIHLVVEQGYSVIRVFGYLVAATIQLTEPTVKQTNGQTSRQTDRDMNK